MKQSDFEVSPMNSVSFSKTIWCSSDALLRARPALTLRLVMTLSVLLVIVHFGLNTTKPALAQQTGVAQAPQLQPPVSSEAETSTLDEPVQLRDQGGNLVVVPRLSYERFEQFLRDQLIQKITREDRVVLESVTLEGTVVGDYLKADIELTATTHGSVRRPYAIPIGLSNFIIEKFSSTGKFQSSVAPQLTSKPANESTNSEADAGPTSEYPTARSTANGLIWTILPAPPNDRSIEQPSVQSDGEGEMESYHSVSLRLSGYLKVRNEEQKKSILFDLPLAVNRQQVTLPVSAKDINWLSDTNLKVSTQESERGVIVETIGMSESSELRWTEFRSEDEIEATEVQSSTRLEFVSDGAPWNAVTRLQIKSPAATATRDFIIELPPNSQWNPLAESGTSGGWTIMRVNSSNLTTAENALSTSSGGPEEPVSVGEKLRLRVSAEELVRANNPIEIRWKWSPLNRPNQELIIKSLMIENIERHEGTIELVVPAQFDLTWKTGASSSLLKRTLDVNATESLNYTFKFSRTPIDIRCTVLGAIDRLQYKPEFLVQLKEKSIELTGLLNFAVDPTKMIGLEIHVGDWAVDKVVWNQSGQPISFEKESPSVIRFDPVSLYRRGDSNPSSESGNGRTIKISLLKPFAQQNTETPVEITLPSIAWLNDQGKSVTEIGTGWLTVFAKEWQIDQKSVVAKAMIPASTTSELITSVSKQTEKEPYQSYLFDEKNSNPSWNATLIKKPNLASQEIYTEIRLSKDNTVVKRLWSIEQNSRQNLALPILMPIDWANQMMNTGNESWPVLDVKLTIDGRDLQCNSAAMQTEESLQENEITSKGNPQSQDQKQTSNSLSVRTYAGQVVPEGWTVLEPILSNTPASFQLELTVTIPSFTSEEELATKKRDFPSRRINILLPRLIDANEFITTNDKSLISTDNHLLATVFNDQNQSVIYPNQSNELNFLTSKMGSLEIELNQVAAVEASSVRINQIWLQTALNGLERRDRCVLDVWSSQDQIEIELFDIDLNSLTRVLVDGQKVEPQRIAGTASLVIPLPNLVAKINKNPATITNSGSVEPPGEEASSLSESSNASSGQERQHTIELWLWSTVNQQLVRRIEENLPLIKAATEPAPKMWQIILPEHDHLWTAAPGLMPQYSWGWKTFALKRQSALGQSELERITHASSQPSFGSETNRYLFSTFSSNLSKTNRLTADYAYVVPRYVLLAPVSLICLAITSLLLYFPKLRSIWVGALLIAIAIAIATFSADLAIILLQVSVASLLFVFTVLIVRWILDRRSYQRTVFVNRTRSSRSSISPSLSIDFDRSGDSQTRSSESEAEELDSQNGTYGGTTRSIVGTKRVPANRQSEQDSNSTRTTEKSL